MEENGVAQQVSFRGQVDALVAEHRSALSARDLRAREEASAAARRVAEAAAECDAQRLEIEGLSRRLRNHADQGDLVAGDRLVSACRSAGLTGAVVLSNLVFKPLDATAANPFYAQVDHLVVSPSGVLLVENKYWDAVVLDGKVPAQQHLRALLTDDEVAAVSAGRSVLRIARDQATAQVTVHRHGGKSEQRDLTPAKQASRQAERLCNLLQASGVACRWVQACVFYSHDRAVVSSEPTQGKAAIAADQKSLVAVIRSALGTTAAGTAPVVVDDVLDVLAPFAGSIKNL